MTYNKPTHITPSNGNVFEDIGFPQDEAALLLENADKKIMTELNYHIYVDGACNPNPGKAGSGMVIYKNKQLEKLYYGGYVEYGTNNIAELNALHFAVKQAIIFISQGVNHVDIFTDSKYSIECVTNWINGWLKNNWKDSKKKDVKNRDIIEPLYNLYNSYKNNITISHVKGHSGIEGNEIADRMSFVSIDKKQVELVEYSLESLDVVYRVKQTAKIEKSLEPTSMRINLKVPYAEKDHAKSLGASWDVTKKIWYITNKQDKNKFTKWL